MNDMYARIVELCKDAGISPSRMCLDLELSKSLITELKAGRSKRLSLDTTQKIADKFSVPISFLTGVPPFEHWERINENRAEFFHYVDFDPELLDMVYGIDSNLLDAEPIKPIIDFLAEQVESALPLEKGGWEVKLKSSYNAKKEPALTEKDGRDIAKDLERVMGQLEAGGDLMFDGDPMSDEARESIKAAMKLGLEAAKMKNKERFTPKQFRKE